MKADWIPLRIALDTVVGAVPVLGAESVELTKASGRILAEEIVSPIDLPRWTNSAMDGYAVRAVDIAGATRESPITLPVVGDIPAGSFPATRLRPGTAARIMTGAPLPEGADSVVRVEHTAPGGEFGPTSSSVSIFSDQDANSNLRRQGEEVRRGDATVRPGVVLGPGSIGVAAALGSVIVRVHRRPLVALLTSGDELVHVEDFDEVLSGNKIVSSNSYSLGAALEEAGCDVRYLGIARDTPESVREALLQADGCDAIVTSGGISVGEYDYLKRVLISLGTRVAFWRVRMKPGSPFAFGIVDDLGGIPWFGLPGNPVSSAVTFEVFARPALLRMGGRTRVHRRAVDARLMEPYEAATGLTHLLRVRLERTSDDHLGARLTGAQGSGMLTSVAFADGLLMIPEERTGSAYGEIFRVLPFDTGMESASPDF